MKAMILAAGQGTRLKPLTETRPKALIEINGVSLLEIIIHRLAGAGMTDIVVNVHHFGRQVRDFLRQKGNFGLNINISDETGLLLDTGGALKMASGLFANEDHVLVHNVDIMSNFDIKEFITSHLQSGAAATLAVKDRQTTRNLLVDHDGRLCGWEYPEKNIRVMSRESLRGLSRVAFSGVYMLSAQLFQKFPTEEVFGFMPWILSICADEKIMTWNHQNAFWYEAGRLDSLKALEKRIFFDPSDPIYIFEQG